MDQFPSWRCRLQIAVQDHMPAIFIDLCNWRESFREALTDGSMGVRIKTFDHPRNWLTIVAKIRARLQR